ncbi:MAG: SemiSWEET transporter [Flavobacteriaceae bacterium]
MFTFHPFEFIGIVAGILTSVAFVPQILKIWKTKSAADISTGMYLVMITGVVLWFIYGLYLQSFAILLSNAVAFSLQLSVLILKFWYSK